MPKGLILHLWHHYIIFKFTVIPSSIGSGEVIGAVPLCNVRNTVDNGLVLGILVGFIQGPDVVGLGLQIILVCGHSRIPL